jgi:hypothetical protein
MSQRITQHSSPAYRDIKKLEQICAIIKSTGSQGIKRGVLICQSGVPFNQWQFFHTVLKDLPEIDWDKSSSRYTFLG